MILACNGLTLAGRLDNVTATFRPGAVTAICGPNGAGKSSLLAALAGLLRPGDGTVMLGAEQIATMRPEERARRIGYLPQQAEIAWDMSVEMLVSLGRIPWRGAGGSGALDAAIAAMALEPLRHRLVSQLSGGERARVLMARVIAGNPKWILADEPLANLDLAHASSLTGSFCRAAAQGAGVVLVLHDLAQAMNHADRVLLLDKGRLVADGPPAEVLTADAIARVWGVSAHWLGDFGVRALSVERLPQDR